MLGLNTIHLKDFLILWITLASWNCEARHVPLSSQRGGTESRPRLLVIRPPSGSSQPNRVVILTNPRKLQNDAEASRLDPSRGFSLASIPGLSTVAESPPPTKPPVDSVGGHPQSQIRRQEESTSGRRSLRNLLEALNSQRKNKKDTSNIARLSDTIPRAAPPVLPTDNRFGNLNIPRVIEAALKRAREKARTMGNVRPGLSGHTHHSDLHGDGSHFHGDTPDLTQIAHHNSAKSRQFAKSNILRPADGQPPKNGKNENSLLTGSGLRSFERGSENRSGRRRGHVDHHNHNHNHNHNHQHQHMNGDTTSGRPDMSLKTSTKMQETVAQNNSTNELSSKSRFITSNVNVATKNGETITPIASKEASGAFHSLSSSNSANTSGKSIVASSGASGASASVEASKPVATLTANATAKVDASSANSTSNTTSTKSIKTKTIKVTTVVKGGTAADVAAAAASQAEIANAVSQGKDINSTSIAEIAKAAAEKNLKRSKLPAGSITVKRENGVSVITLADGIGEPVVIRAKGPVKIERIIRPNGQVQFVINPVETSTKPRTTRATSAEKEIEPEEITTTTFASTTPLYLASTSHYPFLMDSLSPLVVPPNGMNAVNEYGNTLSALDTSPPVTTTVEPVVKKTGTDKRAGKSQVHNQPIQMYPVFQTPKIPRPPPTIPRPPKVPDTMFGNQGLLDSLTASLFVGSNELFLNMQGASTSTASPQSIGKRENPVPADIHSFTSSTDVMPQYDVVQKLSKDFVVR